MNTFVKAIGKIATRKRTKAQNIRRDVDRIRKKISTSGKKWGGTRIIREMRDAR